MTLGGPSFEERAAGWLEPDEAARRILAAGHPLAPEEVPLAESLGRALAEDIVSDALLPPWDNAAMDGYAVRGDDITGASTTSPVELRVLGLTRAGTPAATPVGPGEAVRIMTGAPMAPGADSVVRVEDTDGERRPGHVVILRDRDRCRNVRPGGQDMRPGDRVLEHGEPVHPGTIGVLAALGRTHVAVHRRPTVAIVTTGDELRGPDAFDDVRTGAGIPDSNAPMLAAQVSDAGGVPHLVPRVPDEVGALRAALRDAARADVLVTVGGAALGEADLVKRVLDGEGLRLDFWRIRMRPGSPFSFGALVRAGVSQPVFGLPGNPASAFVTFEVFVRPFLLRLGGHRRVHRRHLRCRAGEALGGGERTSLQRVRLKLEADGFAAFATGSQGSGLVRGLAFAEGLAIVRPGPGVGEGEPVEVILLDPGPAATDASPLEGPEP